MEKRKWLWIGGGVLFLLIVFWGVQQWFQPVTHAEALTKEEAQKVVAEQYPGTILNVVLENDQYTVDVERETGTYRVELDAKTGQVLSLIRIGKKDHNQANAKQTEEEEKGPTNEDESGSSSEQPENNPTTPPNDKETDPQIPAPEKKPIKEPNPAPVEQKQPPKKLTENEAIQIAKGQVQGEVDGVEIESLNGVPYYFVEIEVGDDQEATIQINAITGEVKSLTWDD